jgi:hypothetical protein
MDKASDLTGFDPKRPSPARIYDYWLGGSNNFAVDRDEAERAAAEMPTLRAAIWANRAFLRRAVRYLVEEEGIDQFLDLGSGVPTVGNVHEIAQAANPLASVVYVDIEPVAVAHGRRLLAGNDHASVIQADLRNPAELLARDDITGLLDFSRPVAVLLIAVLHFMPERDDPDGIVRAYREHLAPGSYLAISHAADDTDLPSEQARMIEDYSGATRVPFIHRGPDRLAGWFDDFEIVEPGITQTTEWRPDTEPEPILRTYCAVGRKPGP